LLRKSKTTGQSPQWAVVPVEEEEESEIFTFLDSKLEDKQFYTK
jgi:hypothetical protein